MKGKFFLDTNIFVYSFDHSAKRKREKALQLIQNALDTNNGIISAQVIQEFLNVATKKFDFPLDKLRIYTDHVLEPLCEVYSDMPLYRTALDLKNDHKFSFYDALIVAAAIEANCSTLYSEDLQNNRSIYGTKIINPFNT